VALADATLEELLARIAAREPAPGGGSAAAVAGATAAALVEMAAAFALGRPGTDDERMARTRERAAVLRRRLLELADADRRSYEPVLEAMRLSRDCPQRGQAMRAALAAAAEVPLAIAREAAEAAELGATVAETGSPQLLGDATAAVLLAEAAAAGAARLVELNLTGAPEDERLWEAAECARRAGLARALALPGRG
jgi:formiminotetrahydrofolate cyclodeaminase